MHFVKSCRLVVPVLALALFGSATAAQGAPTSAQPSLARFYDRDCSDFATQAQAQRFYKRHNPRRDPHRLDADRDGIACESLP